MAGASPLATIARIKQRRAPPPSDQPRRLHVQARHHIQRAQRRSGRRRVVDGRRRIDAVRQVALAVLFGIAARLRAALLPVAVVRLDVLRQVVRPHEPLVAHGTREPLLARVRPKMSLQLVGSREPFAAEQPIADEGPFARVPPQMSLQVRRLPIHFTTARNMTTMNVLLPQMHAGRAQALGLLAIGAVARGPARVPPLRSGRRNLGRQRGGRGRRGRGRTRVVQAEGGADRLGAGQHGFVGVLEEMLAGGEQMVGGGQGMRQGRVVRGGVVGGGHLRVHAGRAAHVQPAAGGGRVHVPPRVGRRHRITFYRAMVRRAGHGVEGPRLVRMARVDRAEGRVVRGRRTFHLAQERALVVVDVRIVHDVRLGGGAREI